MASPPPSSQRYLSSPAQPTTNGDGHRTISSTFPTGRTSTSIKNQNHTSTNTATSSSIRPMSTLPSINNLTKPTFTASTTLKKPTRAAKPQNKTVDPWVSSSTGHQVADAGGLDIDFDEEAGGSVSTWMAWRTKKLNGQFGGGQKQGQQQATQQDGQKERQTQSVPLPPPSAQSSSSLPPASISFRPNATNLTAQESLSLSREAEDQASAAYLQDCSQKREEGKLIFEGVTIYINGSTYPVVSDTRVKRIVVEHGGKIAMGLSRKGVSHVVVGKPVGVGKAAREGIKGGLGGSAGGGLAGGKLEKEIIRGGGKAFKIVGVEWILKSVKAGKRLPEARFTTLKVARQGQGSVYGHFMAKPKDSDGDGEEAATPGTSR